MAGEDMQTLSITANEVESVSTIPCAICRRQFSRYTCPRCNIPYCSLVCFRSEKHTDCSESFYRKEVESDVKNAPSANVEEKRRMLDLLKRFEEDSLDDSPLLGDSDNEDEDEDEDDLQRRLQNIDLDSAPYEEIWSALSPAEREKFLHAIDDPDSELAQNLLASEELGKGLARPWWDSSTEPQQTTDVRQERKHGTKPSIMDIPDSLLKNASRTATSGPVLLCNICALFIAYTYTIRHFAVSPLSSLVPTDTDHVEIRKSLSQLVPFLTDRKSTLVHTSLSGVVTDLWSRFPPGEMNPRIFSVLLKDTADLLRPAAVSVVSAPSSSNLEDHPCANALRVLSDIAALFSGVPKSSHVVHKLTFYGVYVIGTPTPLLRVLVDEALMRAKTLEEEGKQGSTGFSHEAAGVRVARKTGSPQTARIEEVS